MRTKKKKKRLLRLFFLLTVTFLALWLYNFMIEKPKEEMMLKYKPRISAELAKYKLNQYTPLLLAIMYQESHGKGNDPMQASESAGLRRNAIDDPDRSIEQGVFHFQKMYRYGVEKKVDLDTIIQSYNMGPGYINFVSQHGFKHTEKLAKQYSELRVKKSPLKYSCGNNFGNFRYPYCFGDYTYAKKVKEKMPYINQIIQKSASI